MLFLSSSLLYHCNTLRKTIYTKFNAIEREREEKTQKTDIFKRKLFDV